jgi:hypothetical protein
MNLPSELAVHEQLSRIDQVNLDRDSPRFILREIYKTSNGTTKITEAYLHCNANTTLETPANVIAVPCADQGNKGKDSCRRIMN